MAFSTMVGVLRRAVLPTSWDASLTLFGGVGYGETLAARGLPRIEDPSGIEKWRLLSAGLNARADLPPLLVQSPDGEQLATVPTFLQLRRAGAPVEWLEYPNEGHVKAGPANKWWVHQRNLDWFRFWLKGEEDPDAAKAGAIRALAQPHSQPTSKQGVTMNIHRKIQLTAGAVIVNSFLALGLTMPGA
jgi:hypothetical protein